MNPHFKLLSSIVLHSLLAVQSHAQTGSRVPDFSPAIQDLGRAINRAMEEKQARDEARRRQKYEIEAAADERKYQAEMRKLEQERVRAEREARIQQLEWDAKVRAEEAAQRKAEIEAALRPLRELATAGKPAQALAKAEKLREAHKDSGDYQSALEPLIANLARQAESLRNQAQAQNGELAALLDARPSGTVAATPAPAKKAPAPDPLDTWLLNPVPTRAKPSP